MNDQRSLKDQLTDLAAMADRAGLYDAADYVRAKINPVWAKHDASQHWNPSIPAVVDHASALLHAAAAEYAQTVAEGMPPLKPHEILAVFREAGCLFEREDGGDTVTLVRDYLNALDAWNGPDGGRGEQEGRLNRAENALRDAVGVKHWEGCYR